MQPLEFSSNTKSEDKEGMKVSRSRKAVTPVVASVILIGVTVAVSIAVAAWLGALPFNFTATEQGRISNLIFVAGDGGSITATFQNVGTNPITLTEAWVNNVKIPAADVTLPLTIAGNNETNTLTINYDVRTGFQYEVKLVSSKGNTFPRTMTVPP